MRTFLITTSYAQNANGQTYTGDVTEFVDWEGAMNKEGVNGYIHGVASRTSEFLTNKLGRPIEISAGGISVIFIKEME